MPLMPYAMQCYIGDIAALKAGSGTQYSDLKWMQSWVGFATYQGSVDDHPSKN